MADETALKMLGWLRGSVRIRQGVAMGSQPEKRWYSHTAQAGSYGLMTVHPVHRHSVIATDPAVASSRTVIGAFDGEHGVGHGMHAAGNDPYDVIARCTFELDLLEKHEPYERHGEWLCGGCFMTMWPCDTVSGLARAYQHKPGWERNWDALIAS